MKTKNTPDINPSNYEEYFLLSLDGELDAATESALFAFLDAHPELAAEVTGYNDTIIPLPEPRPVFEGKEVLLQPETTLSGFRKFRPFIWLAAALLLLWIGVRNLQNDPAEVPRIAIAVAPKTQKTQPAVPSPASEKNTPTPPQIASKEPVFQPSFPEKKTVAAPPMRAFAASTPEATAATGPPEDIAPLPFVNTPLLPQNLPVMSPAPSLVIVPGTEAPSEKGIEISLPVVDAIRDAAADKILALREAGRALKNTETTVYLGKRELFTIRF